ncbi:MAG: DUF4058 family protein [Planctomycetes bacterium]|nr:DUF4058 family protein [Planctomycetota bacterium]
MKPPFPGMDPYLERPSLWADVHNTLIAAVRAVLTALLPPRYYVAIEERIYLAERDESVGVGISDIAVAGRPETGHRDAETGRSPMGEQVVAVEVPVPDQIRETYLEVRGTEGDRALTVIEILSPWNKKPGPGRRLYLKKRRNVLGTETHLVEIDLLRAGQRMPICGTPPTSPYRLLVSRGDRRPHATLYPFGLRDSIPDVPVPLAAGDVEPVVRLGEVLHAQYEGARYYLRIDYRGEAAAPLLPEADRAWVETRLRAAGLC